MGVIVDAVKAHLEFLKDPEGFQQVDIDRAQKEIDDAFELILNHKKQPVSVNTSSLEQVFVSIDNKSLDVFRRDDDVYVGFSPRSWPNTSDIMWSYAKAAQNGEYNVFIVFKVNKDGSMG